MKKFLLILLSLMMVISFQGCNPKKKEVKPEPEVWIDPAPVEPISCNDGKKNGTETDVDCGGNCKKCDEAQFCLVDNDCVSKSCSSGICLAPTCSDGKKNGNETDVDCGGDCTGCGYGGTCQSENDCLTEQCYSNVCVQCQANEDCANDEGCLMGMCVPIQ